MTVRILPEKKGFLSSHPAPPPLYAELPYKDPASVYARFRAPRTALLESVKGTERIGRYSFIALEPCLEFRVKDSVVEVLTGDHKTGSVDGRPLGRLRKLLNLYRQRKDPSLPPFQGGFVGIFSYDFVHYFERLPRTARDDLELPDAHFFLVDRLFAFDAVRGKAYAVVCPGVRDAISALRNPGSGFKDLSVIYDEAEASLQRMVDGYGKAGDAPVEPPAASGPGRVDIVYEMTKREYMEMVLRAKDYIRAGDIFQANLSQRLSAETGAPPWDIYRVLRRINPAPFSAFVDFGGYQIVSSSPERLIRLVEGSAETRPIAGTRPRGATLTEDRRLRADLLLNEKERAEHIMLIDLERNDLGRVCSYGTVKVDELMITEDYSHVIHIVSNITGTLAGGRDAFSLVRAVFPGGTITGVPKVRCMEIIDELEPVVRGPYTGSLGYIGFNGSMDLNIIIRTFVVKGERVYVQAGAGIVADSDPEREYYETLKKAEALLLTLERL